MPTKTFMNLQDDKKERLERAALREFSNYTYENISINRIIQSIDLPRGSFYLYFNDKEDLYLYIINKYKSDVINFAYENVIKSSDNIVEIYDKLLVSIINYCDKHGEGALLKHFMMGLTHNLENKVLHCATKDEKSFIDELTVKFSSLLDGDEEEKKSSIFILTTLLFHSLTAYYILNWDFDLVQSRYRNQLNIIKNGIRLK